MLPRSCLRLADSKSNSSTRWPRRTTTRVSSGWVASMSILLGIDQSHGGRLARSRPSSPHGRRGTARPETGRTVVERTGQRTRCVAVSQVEADCLAPQRVASRRAVAVAAKGLVVDARSQHDLLARAGAAALARATAGSLG